MTTEKEHDPNLTVRGYRHETLATIRTAANLLTGVPGLSAAAQAENMAAVRDLLVEASKTAEKAHQWALTRDFEAHQATKGKPVGTSTTLTEAADYATLDEMLDDDEDVVEG